MMKAQIEDSSEGFHDQASELGAVRVRSDRRRRRDPGGAQRRAPALLVGSSIRGGLLISLRI